MSDKGAIVSDFIRAWNAMDLEAIMGFFTEDAVYINIPMEPANEGKAAIRAFIEGFIGTCSAMDFVIHNQVEGSDGVVMNERTDRITMGDKVIELQVMGIFELEGDKIKAWRDYFDLATFTSQMAG